MNQTVKTLLVIAVAATAGFALHNFSTHKKSVQEIKPEVIKAFESWSLNNMRLYASPSEQEFRIKAFANNYETVQELRTKVSHQVGLTIFADLTEEEFLTKHTGLVPRAAAEESATLKSSAILELAANDLEQMPERVDHRETGLSTPVKNQRMCGSCWAFAAIASLEGAWIKAKHPKTIFSEQQLVDCSLGYGNNGCQGGWMTFGYKYLQENGGMRTSSYPYMSTVQDCKQKEPEFVVQVERFVELPARDPAALKRAVAKNIVSVAVDSKSWMLYSGGIVKSQCDNKLNHGAAIIGYGVEQGTNDKYWIIKNSWGENWGENGYIRVLNTERNDDGVCGINMINSYVDLVIEAH
jgi:KDEL-tailed cysteine endopeptidase